jgi:N-acetylglucosamine kinase-like BadF-type ATPase
VTGGTPPPAGPEEPPVDYVLGVDAGNTKTVALLARLDGGIVGAGRAGCGDIYGADSAEAALGAIRAAVGAATAQAGGLPGGPAAQVYSCAGADWPEDFPLLAGALIPPGARGRIVNDAVGALRAGSAAGPAVVVVCGTGAATAARGLDGRVWHTSHWQQPQGGEELARRALWTVYRAALGIDPPTGLTDAALRHFGVPSVEDVLHLCTARGNRARARMRQFGPLLLDVAATGDPTAARIVAEQGAALGDFALAAARQVGIAERDFSLTLLGGVLRHPCRILRDSLIARVCAGAPGARPEAPRWEPAAGAVLLALEDAGGAVTDAVAGRLRATMPPLEWFAT